MITKNKPLKSLNSQNLGSGILLKVRAPQIFLRTRTIVPSTVIRVAADRGLLQRKEVFFFLKCKAAFF